MFELSVALKYLIPRKRQLSVSIIALVSVLVIALVVWLVVVFLSVTHGIERRWIETLTSLNAPLRLTPTEKYYNSYYYKIDELSSASDFTSQSLAEKRQWAGDPYDPDVDPTLPPNFPKPNKDANGHLRNLVGGTFAAVEKIPGVTARDFDITVANLRLRLLLPVEESPFFPANYSQTYLNQVCYFAAFDPTNPYITKTFVTPTADDASHVLDMLSLSQQNVRQEAPEKDALIPQADFQQRLQTFFSSVQVGGLQTAAKGWVIPPQLYPQAGKLKAFAVMRGQEIDHLELQEKEGAILGTATFEGGELLFNGQVVPFHCALVVPPAAPLKASLDLNSLSSAYDAADLRFHVQFDVQGVPFQGTVPYQHLLLDQVKGAVTAPYLDGHPIYLATSFRDHDVHLGDFGFIAYYANSPSALQEQRLPVYVAGFYDPGLMPAGNKLVFVNPSVINDIRASMNYFDEHGGNGIAVWFDDVYRADEIKKTLLANLEAEGLAPYWKVETYKEYEFAKPLLEQFSSDRTLFSAIALMIIAVACSNIVSMLILLVNDKRKEIGVLRAMGAKPYSIGLIFAFCGTSMGILGSTLGIGASLLTLRYLDHLIVLLNALQGHSAFQEAFYGQNLPSALSLGSLFFVAGATVVVSLIAGIIPAIKATRLCPSTILRSE
ncbi:MAG: ABC transporter permease [Verrucomicrobia bacterium]|nr:ABC transporter permease [Verrucomicrobiota bacterium]